MTDPTAHALTTDEVRANAGKWTLAADVGLLAHLQQFSEEIIKKSEVAESSLNQLLDQVEETCTNFNNVSNQFLSLQNSQFLENRVYDDETPTEEKDRPQTVGETQQQTLEKYKEAVSIGLGLLDTHFEEVVMLESSDSEEEASDGNPALVLRPKTPYTKPLPLIIGSAEWWADDNVGLGEFQENEDSEPEVTVSDSEPNVIRPQVEKRLIRNLSSSSSASSMEEEIVPPVKKPNIPSIITIPVMDEPPVLPTNDDDDSEDMFKPVDDLFSYAREQSLFGEKHQNKDDLFPVSKPIETLPTPGDDLFKPKPVANRVSNAFTKELAAKLGTVAKNQESVPKDPIPEPKKTEEVPPIAKTRTIPVKPETKVTDKKLTGLFGEHDEDDDLFSGVSNTARVKEPSRLFDDDEDDDLFSSGKKMDPVDGNQQRGGSTYDSIMKPAAASNLFSGFEDDLEDDNDLFAPKSVPKIFSTVKLASANDSPLNDVKTSTPALQGTPAVPSGPNPPDDLFGSISRVGNESREQSIEPSHESSQIAPNPADVAMMNDTHDESRDLGFIESSSLGEESKKDSPANWFHPQLSSTHAVGSSHETSGYKTGTGGAESAAVDSRSDSKPVDKRFSSILEDSSPGKGKKDTVSRKSWLDDESEDLFSKPVKKIDSDLFGSSDGDLFSTKPKIQGKKMEDAVVSKTSSWKPSSIFDDDGDGDVDGDGLFDDGKKLPDNVSVSSSRSSLFEEPGKSNLPGIFGPKVEKPKISLFDDVDDDFDLFGKKEGNVSKITKAAEKTPSVAKPLVKVEVKNKESGLFDDDDDDDLFSKVKKETVKPKPPSSLPVTKTSDLLKKVPDDIFSADDDLFKTEPKPTSSSDVIKTEDIKNPVKKIGKLNVPIGLKINPATLLPGTPVIIDGKVSLPNQPETSRPPSDLFGETKNPGDETDGEILPSKTADLQASKPTGKLNIPTSLKINPSALLPRPVKTEPDTDVNTVLTSAARDRPRIQVKRRPQTRKARHEALRHSGIDFGPDDEPEDNFMSPASDNSVFHSVENSPSPAFVSADVVSPSTDEEDCLSFPDVSEREELKNDGVLFGNAPVISPENDGNIPIRKKLDVDDEDLFGGSVPASSLFDDVKVPKKLQVASKSLFGDDDDDDDDIFKSSVVKSSVEPVASVSSTKVKVEKKVTEPFVDPLGLLHE